MLAAAKRGVQQRDALLRDAGRRAGAGQADSRSRRHRRSHARSRCYSKRASCAVRSIHDQITGAPLAARRLPRGLGWAAFLTWSSEQHLRLDDGLARDASITTARAAGVAVADLRAAQQAYVAVGQGEDFWFARVLAIRKDLDDKLAELKSLAIAPEAVTALDDAAGALQDFVQMDLRARDYTREPAARRWRPTWCSPTAST